MKRAIILGLAVDAVAIAAVPAIVSAQGFPPPPPTTYYGKAPTGVQPGDTVIAVVTEGASSMVCGDGVTSSDASGTVYVVDVVADAQIAGCGKTGRTVQFYFVGVRSLAVGAAQWGPAGPAKFDLTTLGPTLTPKNRAPQVAKDGVN